MKDLLKKALAEFVGTCMLVVIACGCAARFGGGESVVGYLATSLTFGLCLTAACVMFGNISGCHINPAVSFAMLIDRRITVKEFFVYIASQFAGGLAGAGFLALFCLMNGKVGTGTVMLAISNSVKGVGYNIAAALIAEIVMTFIFVFSVMAATGEKGQGKFACVTVGVALTLVHLMGIGLTGTSVNPARSFGPALVALFAGESSPILYVWIFIIAPLAGGALAAFVYRFLYGERARKD